MSTLDRNSKSKCRLAAQDQAFSVRAFRFGKRFAAVWE